MAHFDIFYYENSIHTGHPLDPRHVLREAGDEFLTLVAETGDEDVLTRIYGAEIVQRMLDIGAIRREEADIVFDTPVFLQDDAQTLTGLFREEAERLASLLVQRGDELYALVRPIRNGFAEAVNLYHILCGMVLDGLMFDELRANGTVAVSKMHPSGMDYLIILYEKCKELDVLSRRLLCSWNRLSDGTCALQSFGDTDGDRHDFYRSYRLQELTRMQGQFPECALLPPERELLAAVKSLVLTGICPHPMMHLLDKYGYAKEGRICVPVYRQDDQAAVEAVHALVRKTLLQPMSELLSRCELDITAVRHGVNRAEIANELYHILFGQINEALVARDIVAAPMSYPNEGRYLKSIQLY